MTLEEILEEHSQSHPMGYKNIDLFLLISDVEKHFPNFNPEKYANAMFGNTVMRDENDHQIVYYTWDVKKALQCGIENRFLKQGEWD